jgi:dihydroxyacid dehydratase/phosphogluconate dehydratase
MYTANTMASAIEAMGMSLALFIFEPALSDEKKKNVWMQVKQLKLLLGKKYLSI